MEQKLETGISLEYVKNWTVEMAIRELIQNYLDVRQQTGCAGSITWKENDARACIVDEGPGLELRHLALGICEKTNGEIGQFGEGLKLALMVLCRENRAPIVRSAGQLITPTVEVGAFECPTLTFRVRPDDTVPQSERPRATILWFSCTQEELSAAKNYFACFRQDLVPTSTEGLSLPGGRIFVNGALVGHVQGALFSYHLQGKAAQTMMNRDREVIDTERLKPLATDILAKTPDKLVLTVLLQDLLDQAASWECKNLEPTPSYALCKVWKEVWESLVGPNTAIGNAWSPLADIQHVTYLGYKTTLVPYPWSYLLVRSGIPAITGILDNLQAQEIATIPPNELTPLERETLRRARALCERYYHTVTAPIVVAEDLRALSRAGDVEGVHRDGVIYLGRSILQHLDRTLGALLHETVHAVTGYKDCTQAFEESLLTIAVNLILRHEEEEGTDGQLR